MSFCKERQIKATRKDRTCESCEKPIPAGSPAFYGAGLTDDGDFYSWHAHPDCRAAEVAWNSWAGQWGDEFAWLWCIREAEVDDRSFGHFDWLRDNFPAAAPRVLP